MIILYMTGLPEGSLVGLPGRTAQGQHSLCMEVSRLACKLPGLLNPSPLFFCRPVFLTPCGLDFATFLTSWPCPSSTKFLPSCLQYGSRPLGSTCSLLHEPWALMPYLVFWVLPGLAWAWRLGAILSQPLDSAHNL